MSSSNSSEVRMSLSRSASVDHKWRNAREGRVFALSNSRALLTPTRRCFRPLNACQDRVQAFVSSKQFTTRQRSSPPAYISHLLIIAEQRKQH